MSNPQERPAGTSGSTMGQPRGQEYEQGKGTGRYEAERGREAEAERGRAYAPAGRRGEHRGAAIFGTALAGTLMVLGGLWGVIVGLVTLSTNHVFVLAPSTTYYYYWTYNGWGWVELILGAVLFATGVCVLLGMAWARYVGAAVAVLSAIAHFMFIPYSPIWSIIMIAFDGFIIWSLLVPRRVPGEL